MDNGSRFRIGSGIGGFALAGMRERFQWAGYGFVAGLLIGLLTGVFFYSIVSLVLRYGLVALLLVPLVWLVFTWRGRRPSPPPPTRSDVVARGGDGSLIDTIYVLDGDAKPDYERRER